ncbi:hypothetical protein Glove_229g106 [Diversispora epigaea]|uniref:Uncharacterized protein n=1 Tax=Diversispora epigaea TaxID=1348612 RepID=A0A397ICV8_9GLOM|nr:hypothetical protein Glove_229g106 [Diversispora epigaea]
MVKNDSSLTENEKNVLRITGKKSAFYAMQSGNHPHHIDVRNIDNKQEFRVRTILLA